MKKTICDVHGARPLFLAIAAALAVLSGGAAENAYVCSMHVGNALSEQQTSNSSHRAKKRGGSSSKTKSVTRAVSWPVTVSVSGKTPPPENAIKLKCYFIGETNGQPTILGEKKLDVHLDENGNMKTVVSSPAETIEYTTPTSRTRGRRGRGGGSRRNVSTNTRTSKSGTRVTGCIIQLMVNGIVERSFASNPGWRNFAKSDPIPREEVLKIR